METTTYDEKYRIILEFRESINHEYAPEGSIIQAFNALYFALNTILSIEDESCGDECGGIKRQIVDAMYIITNICKKSETEANFRWLLLKWLINAEEQ